MINVLKKIKLPILIAQGAFLIGMTIDLILNALGLMAVTPAEYNAAAIGIAAIIVLFAITAWMRGIKILWAVLAGIALFFDVSFMLAITEAKSETAEIIVEAENDLQLERIDERINDAEEKMATALEWYSQDGLAKSTYDFWKEQYDNADADLKEHQSKYDERLEELESGVVTERKRNMNSEITHNDVFYSIPKAVENNRWIEIIIWAAIFGSLQFVIVFGASQEKGRPIADKKAVREFVKSYWNRSSMPKFKQPEFIEQYKGEIDALLAIGALRPTGDGFIPALNGSEVASKIDKSSANPWSSFN